MDAIANLLSSIRNAGAVGKPVVAVPYSNFLFAIAKVLEREGFIASAARKGKKVKAMLEVGLRYDERKPRVNGAERVSKLSRRMYTAAKDIQPVKNGHGRLILSTPKGIMTGSDAKKENVGGEALFIIW